MAECMREKLLRCIQQHSFVANELQLFLDTHPCDKCSFEELKRQLHARHEAIEEYEKHFGPLTYDGLCQQKCYNWIQSPWPWEREG